MTKEWGPATWCMFHTLSYKLKSNESEHVKELLTIYIGICYNLPCPFCRDHAVEILRKANTNQVSNKADLMIFMWQFHNIVNKKLRKREFTYEEYVNKYKNMVPQNAVETFLRKMYKTKERNVRQMTSKLSRNIKMKQFNEYYIKNKHRYDD